MAWHPTQPRLCILAASDMTVRLVQLPAPGRAESSQSPDQVPIVGIAWHLVARAASVPACADLRQEPLHLDQEPSLHGDWHMAWAFSGHTIAVSRRADLWLLHLHTPFKDQQTPHADKAQAPQQQSTLHCSRTAFDQRACQGGSFQTAHALVHAGQQRSLPEVQAQQQLLLGVCPISALRAADDGRDAFLATTAPPLQTDAARQPALHLRLPQPGARVALDLPGAAPLITPIDASHSDPLPPTSRQSSASDAPPDSSHAFRPSALGQCQQQQSFDMQQPNVMVETSQIQQMPHLIGHGLHQDSHIGLACPAAELEGRGQHTSANASEASVLATAANPPASLTSQLFAECAQVLDQPMWSGACDPDASPAATYAAPMQAFESHQPGSAAGPQQGVMNVLRLHDAAAIGAMSQEGTVGKPPLSDWAAGAPAHGSAKTSRLACHDDHGDPAGQAQQSQIWLIEAVQPSSSMRQEASPQQPLAHAKQAVQGGRMHQHAASGLGLVTHAADVACRAPDLLEVCIALLQRCL